MHSLFVSLLLMQDPYGNLNVRDRGYLFEVQKKMIEEQPTFEEAQQADAKRQAAIEEYFFIQKYNKFIETLKEFANEYQAGTVDVSKAKAVKKAWRDLEKTDGWLKADKSRKQQCDQQP